MAAPGYNVRKAAQVVAFFAYKEGGKINVLKLSKLLYLADREFMDQYDRPILYDRLVSMDHGPVTSYTLSYIDGYSEDRKDWESFVTDRSNYAVGLNVQIDSLDDFDELSEAETDILAVVWDKFGAFSKWQLRDFTHINCPEWENPNGTSLLIPYERVFKFLGKTDAAALSERVERARELDRLFAE